MATREATCSCGQLRLQAEGDPFHVSICHCLSCQRRTGSAFGMQAGYVADRVTTSGTSREYARTSDEADRKVHVFHFCPEDAIAHLRLAVDAHDDLRTLAAEDPDLEPIRGEPGFRELLG